MRITRKSIVKGRDPVYVVTRDNRRVEPNNYNVKWEAEDRADRLVQVVNTYDPKSRGRHCIYLPSRKIR